MPTLHEATFAALDAPTAYRLLALRSAIFVVEQDCPYLDPDGRDLEPDALQLWAEHDGEIVSTLRLLHDADGRARIGRVATAVSARGSGVAGRLMARALELAGERELVLDAQTYLQAWYGRFGFVVSGPEYVEDGIPHVPMRRPAEQDGSHAELPGTTGR
jgi:ElaA protein